MAKSKYVGYRTYICFGDIDESAPWDKLGYLAWHERAQRYLKAGYRQKKCRSCSRWHWHDQPHDCPGLKTRERAEVTT